MEEKKLADIASAAKEKAYAPYSKFRVGAVVLADSGKLYTGVNVENVSFGATCCAERAAVFKAVSEGERKIKAVAIASDSEELIFPCGMCRQVLAEFGDRDMPVICTKNNGDYRVYTLEELLPNAFLHI